MTEEEIARLRELADKATPGPWDWIVHDYTIASLGVLPDPGLGDPLVLSIGPCKGCQERAKTRAEQDGHEPTWQWGCCHTPDEATARYIAALHPETVKAMLDDRQALQERIRELEGLADRAFRSLEVELNTSAKIADKANRRPHPGRLGVRRFLKDWRWYILRWFAWNIWPRDPEDCHRLFIAQLSDDKDFWAEEWNSITGRDREY